MASLIPSLPRKSGTVKEISAAEPDAFQNSIYEVLLSSHDLVENARIQAEQAGYHTIVDNSCDDWDYAEAAGYLLKRFHALRAEHPRCCLISGGEVTVTLNKAPGAGGRNQQFALCCALELANYPQARLIVFSAGVGWDRWQHPFGGGDCRYEYGAESPGIWLQAGRGAGQLRCLPASDGPGRYGGDGPRPGIIFATCGC